MIRFNHRGGFGKTERFLNLLRGQKYLNVLHKYGQEGVRALASATPVGSGKTASSWTYKIEQTKTRTTIFWTNTNTNDGANIALLLQYGHGTGTGGFVRGIDYINPAMAPIFEQIAREAWREVTSL